MFNASKVSFKREVFPENSKQHARQLAMPDPSKAWPRMAARLTQYCVGNAPWRSWPKHIQKMALNPHLPYWDKYTLTQFLLYNGYSPNMIMDLMVADKGWKMYQVNRLVDRMNAGDHDKGDYFDLILNRVVPYNYDVSQGPPRELYVPPTKKPRFLTQSTHVDMEWVRRADEQIRKDQKAEEEAKKAKVILEDMALLDLKCQCCGQPI